MMEVVEKRRAFIINLIYFAIIVGIAYLCLKYALWIVMPFVISFIIAALLQKPLLALTRNKHMPKSLIGTLLALLVFVVILGAVAFGGYKLVNSVGELITYFTERCSNLAEFFDVLKQGYLSLEIANRLPEEVNSMVLGAISSVADYVESGKLVTAVTENISKIATPLGSVISTVPSFFAGLLVSIVAACFMTIGFQDIKSFILRQIPDDKEEKALRAKHILVSSIGKMCKAYSLIIVITTTELFVGLSILKILGINSGSHNFLISFLIALVDIVPILGTGTIVIPWSLISFIMGDIGMGIGLLIIYVVITVIRQIIEPKLVAGQVGMSPVITIMAMYIGIRLFGTLGIFILPFITIIVKLLNDEGIIHLFKPNPEDVEKLHELEKMGEKAQGEKKKLFDIFKKNKN